MPPQIVAVILVDTGIALLAYMDGINGSKTLTSVVLAALSGAGYAVFRVMFRKMMGDPPPVGRIAFTFTIIGIINAALLWPICLSKCSSCCLREFWIILFFFQSSFILPWGGDDAMGDTDNNRAHGCQRFPSHFSHSDTIQRRCDVQHVCNLRTNNFSSSICL